MIVVDMNQITIANVMAQVAVHKGENVEEDLLRHMILNTLRSLKVKFAHEYGEMVIACDHQKSWRKEAFPYYKANRKKSREQSKLDWAKLFAMIGKIRDEIKESFPYRVIYVEGAEGDDVIATLCRRRPQGEPFLIVSGDKDFRQLHDDPDVTQYDPISKRTFREENPQRYLKEHILRGDRTDGIPNFLSEDSVFIDPALRQKPITQKSLEQWLDQDFLEFCDPKDLKKLKRNIQLVDLSYIPGDVQTRIIDAFDAQAGKGRGKIYNYMIEHKMVYLLDEIQSF